MKAFLPSGKTALNISDFSLTTKGLNKQNSGKESAYGLLLIGCCAIPTRTAPLTRVGPVWVSGSLAPADLHGAALSVLMQGPNVALSQCWKTKRPEMSQSHYPTAHRKGSFVEAQSTKLEGD